MHTTYPLLLNRITSKRFSLCLLFIFSLCLPYAASAGERAGDSAEDSSQWSVTLGGGVTAAPEFEGSDKYELDVVPLVNITFMDRFFLSSEKGLGFYAFNTPEWNAGASVNYGQGRRQKDSRLLKGMGNINDGAIFTLFGEWTPDPFSAGVEASYGTGDLAGLTVTGSLGHTLTICPDLQWANTFSTTYASSRYNNTFFGITDRQSRNSHRHYDSYHAGSGIKDVSFTSTLTYGLTDNISVLLSGEYKRLTGPAAKSPIVKEGSKNQASSTIGVMYSF